MFDKLSEDQRQALNIVREENNLFITGQSGTARKNNCLLLSIFSAGSGGFGQMMSRCPERSPQDSQDDFFCTVPRPSFPLIQATLPKLKENVIYSMIDL